MWSFLPPRGRLGGSIITVQVVLGDSPDGIRENAEFFKFPASLCAYPLVSSCFVNHENVVLFSALGISLEAGLAMVFREKCLNGSVLLFSRIVN